jgi:hypothetical protein
LSKNFDELEFQFDWRPLFNTLLETLSDNDLKTEMKSLSDKFGNFFEIIQKLLYKINKFFPKGEALNIFNELKPNLCI